ncbi:MAG TPA: hypothetical protein VIM65_15345 [Cyclobacteriaceae bacterium]
MRDFLFKLRVLVGFILFGFLTSKKKIWFDNEDHEIYLSYLKKSFTTAGGSRYRHSEETLGHNSSTLKHEIVLYYNAVEITTTKEYDLAEIMTVVIGAGQVVNYPTSFWSIVAISGLTLLKVYDLYMYGCSISRFNLTVENKIINPNLKS